MSSILPVLPLRRQVSRLSLTVDFLRLAWLLTFYVFLSRRLHRRHARLCEASHHYRIQCGKRLAMNLQTDR
jgi:hypothetical protein